ncbi:MAG: hypothetical protein HY707_12405 [Ignavibacteriae bacterium]|nr:hypothetical protein [Ignavibacteriota bacterium]
MKKISISLSMVLSLSLISCTNKFNDAEDLFKKGRYEDAYLTLSHVDSSAKDYPAARRLMVLSTIRQYSLLTDSLMHLYQKVDENTDSSAIRTIKSILNARNFFFSRLDSLQQEEQTSGRLSSEGLKSDSVYDLELNPSRIALANIHCFIASWDDDYSSRFAEARSSVRLITRGKEASQVDDMLKEIDKRERQRKLEDRARRLFGTWDFVPFFGSGGCRGYMRISQQWLEVDLYCSSPFYSFDRKYFINDIKWKPNGDVTLVCQGVYVTLTMEKGGFAWTNVESSFDPEARIILGGKRFHK